MRTITACLSFALLTACAGIGERTANPAPPATVATAPSEPVIEPVGSVEPVISVEEVTVAKAKAGYALKQKGGVAVYCRRETPTGSRRPVENCYTPQQLEAIEAATDEAQNSLNRQRNSSGCGKFCSAGS
jgi:hypothetical protein